MSTLSLQNLSKHFTKDVAVRDVNLDIRSGEFFSILGPSGCGKTTLLRMIAGFEPPTSGRIFLNERDLTGVPPQSRAIGMVFQNYALFPHMTVFENVAFGLETAGRPKDEIRERVEKMLHAVHLKEKIHEYVPNLSGGEQQRVAVARALVVEPSVLLFDEPLSNLDVSLRWKTREEIRLLQRRTRITTVYVTHDQSEAMSLSDRIAVMREGMVEQVGTPLEIYEHPVSPFVAQFVGGANLIDAIYDAEKGALKLGSTELLLRESISYRASGKVKVAIKPEAVAISPQLTKDRAEAVVETKEYLGFTTHFVIAAWGVQLRVSSTSSKATEQITPGMRVGFEVDWSRCTFFPER